jgi:hypothetical protein
MVITADRAKLQQTLTMSPSTRQASNDVNMNGPTSPPVFDSSNPASPVLTDRSRMRAEMRRESLGGDGKGLERISECE